MTIKINFLKKKQLQDLSNADLKKRLIQSHLARDICAVENYAEKELSFDLEIFNIQEELDKRQKDENMVSSRFKNEIPNFGSKFYRHQLKKCISADQIKNFLNEIAPPLAE